MCDFVKLSDFINLNNLSSKIYINDMIVLRLSFKMYLQCNVINELYFILVLF